MTKLSSVILTNTKDEVSYKMTLDCVTSLFETTKHIKGVEVILVESFLEYDSVEFPYPDNIVIVEPKENEFNFHRNLNYGFKQSKGAFITFCNNDLLFHKGWFDEILKVAQDKTIKAFSPVDPKMPKLPYFITSKNDYVEGYEIQKHFKGWCFVTRREVFDTVGKFDERFRFYAADKDFALTLYKYNIKHVTVTGSEVEHVKKRVLKPKIKNVGLYLEKLTINKSKIPKYIIEENRWWLVVNDKMAEGTIEFHKKWGSYRELKIKHRLATCLEKIKLPYLKRCVYFSK